MPVAMRHSGTWRTVPSGKSRGHISLDQHNKAVRTLPARITLSLLMIICSTQFSIAAFASPTSSEKLPPQFAAFGSTSTRVQSDPGCIVGRDNRQSDLCAQWKAADAAADAARAAYWTWLASVFGLLLGMGTLIAAWRAAHWAKSAARHTEAGATAANNTVTEAQKANKIAADVADRQLRAYLFPSVGELVLTASDLTASCPIRIVFKNTGATPATLTGYTIRTGVRSQLRQRQAGVENSQINKVETRIGKIIGPNNETYLSISGEVELKIFSPIHVAAAGGESRAVEFNAVIAYDYLDYRDRRWQVEAEFTSDAFIWNGKGKRQLTMRQKAAKETRLP